MSIDKKSRACERKREIFGRRYEHASFASARIDAKTSQEIATWINAFENIMVLHGPAGTGKTYISAAIFDYVCDSVKSVRCWRESKFLKELHNRMNDGSLGGYLEWMRYMIDDEFLVFDDFGSSGHDRDWET